MFNSIFNRMKTYFRKQLSGWGECSKGCGCKAFVEAFDKNICKTCGHTFNDYW